MNTSPESQQNSLKLQWLRAKFAPLNVEIAHQKVVKGKDSNDFEFNTRTVYFIELAISYLKAFTYSAEDSSIIGSGVVSCRDIAMCAILFMKLYTSMYR